MVKTHLLSFLTRDWSMALSLAGSLTSSGLYCWAFTCLLMSSMSWLIEAWERNSEDKCATLLAKVTTWDSKRLNRLLTALFEKSREKKISWRNLSTMNCTMIIQWNPALQPPRYYSYFFCRLAKTAIHFLVKKKPSLTRPILSAHWWPY